MYPGTYVISLDEVPLLVGNAQADKAYCIADPAQLVGLGVPEEEIEEASEPVTLRPGCWLPRQYWDVAHAHQLPLWTDPLIFVIHHVEAVLRDNLAHFVGVQDVENMLESWSTTDEGRERIASALPDADARLRFARLLRALARERVPISDWRTILTAFQAAGPPTAELHDLVHTVRGALRASLPGNEPGARRLELPTALEDQIRPWVTTHAGKTFFALPPEDTQELLGEIRELLTENDAEQLVLVVQDGRTRPFVRRLVELEFPRIMVLAQDERLELDGAAAVTAGARQAEGAASNA
jgi:type III secretory pathway component EscV